jgi:PilZ domain
MRAQPARRSDRVSVTVPIEVIGTDIEGQRFAQRSCTIVVSRYGASVAVARKLAPKQEFVIRRLGLSGDKKAEVRVLRKIGAQSDKYVYGVMLLDPSVDLWDIDFPPPAESEQAVARTLLECACCKSREVTYLNETEFQAFVANQGIVRFCRNCGASTTWKQALRDFLSRPGLPQAAARTRTEDRRKEARSKVSLIACIRRPESDEEVVVCENISHGGLSFRSKNPYTKGSRIEVAVPYSPRAANIFVSAWVVYSQELSRGDLFRHGVTYRICTHGPNHEA